MSDPGAADDDTSWAIQLPVILPDIAISPDDPTYQAPSIMGGVDFSGQGISPGGLSNIAGKIWNLPNTALGLAYGGAGYLAGQVNHALGGQKDAPGVQFGNNAIQFTNNPWPRWALFRSATPKCLAEVPVTR